MKEQTLLISFLSLYTPPLGAIYTCPEASYWTSMPLQLAQIQGIFPHTLGLFTTLGSHPSQVALNPGPDPLYPKSHPGRPCDPRWADTIGPAKRLLTPLLAKRAKLIRRTVSHYLPRRIA